MKTDLFQSCGHFWVFQICWHIECRTFTASSFRIWNSSTGIPSPPLALFVVMLSKAHLTFCIPGCLVLGEWSYHHDYLGCEDLFYFFGQFFCVFLPTLLNIFCFCWVPTISVLIVPIFAWNVPLASLIFLKRSLVLPILLFSAFFALIAEEDFLISPCYSLELCIQMCISFLSSFAFHFPSKLPVFKLIKFTK